MSFEAGRRSPSSELFNALQWRDGCLIADLRSRASIDGTKKLRYSRILEREDEGSLPTKDCVFAFLHRIVLERMLRRNDATACADDSDLENTSWMILLPRRVFLLFDETESAEHFERLSAELMAARLRANESQRPINTLHRAENFQSSIGIRQWNVNPVVAAVPMGHFFTAYGSCEGLFLAPTTAQILLGYPNEIVEGRVFLGSSRHALAFDVLSSLRISHVVNISDIRACTSAHAEYGIRYLDITGVDDCEEVDISQYFDGVVEFFRAAIEQRGDAARVFIHCQAGVSRSATLTAMILMRLAQKTAHDALEYIATGRPCVLPNRGFLKQLVLLESTGSDVEMQVRRGFILRKGGFAPS